MTEVLSYSTAFMLGLLGGVHCVGMCGGIMSALSFSVPQTKRNNRTLLPILLSYNFGRLLSYATVGALIGALIGGTTWLLQDAGPQLAFALRIFSGVMLIIMGLYVARWWLGLSYLESAGGKLWQYLQPIGKRLMPVTSPSRAILLGMVWGWLPCGLVYSVAIWASSAANWQHSALIMVCFGLGTLPVMLVTGHLAIKLKTFVQSRQTQAISASLIILFGVWTIAGAYIYASPDANHQEHMTNHQEHTTEHQGHMPKMNNHDTQLEKHHEHHDM